jgi:4-hydroxy-3-methylbut-2-enyl diphosphate reductase
MRQLTILLVRPRGFCAGVERAIRTVEEALARFGAPVFVRHEIVHNSHVVGQLAAKGAIFVDELDAVPDGVPVVFSAHGVTKSVRGEAERRGLPYIDATCPLVTKVHREVERHAAAGRRVILIGHRGHPEVVGTLGQAVSESVILIQSTAEAATLPIDKARSYGLVMQTTLCVSDAEEITAVLRARIPRLYEPAKSDLCYATTNRQMALRAIANRCEAIIVVGGANSSNSRRLVEVARAAGCPKTALVQDVAGLELSFFEGVTTLGVTAGASTPEILVQEVIEYLDESFSIDLDEIVTTTEDTHFNLPRFPERKVRRAGQ